MVIAMKHFFDLLQPPELVAMMQRGKAKNLIESIQRP